ncbi:MAG: tRNA (adenosine(37)-N6)-threonylcarbamoyltransferase complex ATPase subunit type 1 TsaE [Flavobacteriales bacterium]|nr:MAG: tRNA (adenosine(37)-N6)-threonylcarbamoyltransferase complex ATPase subunit type 1 TsaE [Flavobacteriales bacterium]
MSSYKAYSEQELKTIASALIQDFRDQKVILFYGEMGVGKTTLIKVICKQLGVEEVTNSPTFSIINEYLSTTNESIYHFDFYRIEKEAEVFDLGYEDYFYSGNYCFVEWPEKIPNLLPNNSVKVNIVQDEENNRIISVVP